MARYKIFVFGLDNAGKTTITKYIKEEAVVETSPTLSFSIDHIIIEDIYFVMWDAPGQVHLRRRWDRGILDTNVLMFVLDTSEKERFNEAKEVLDDIMEDPETRSIPLIFCFHKMDTEEAIENVENAFSIFNLTSIRDRGVYPFKTSVMPPEGIEDLKDKLVEIIQKIHSG